jgi:molybdopterin molybdotransferase
VSQADMRSVEDHLAVILAGIGTIEPIQLPLLDSQGLLLAEDVHADWALPSFDNAGVDGYAVRAVDIRSATEEQPVTLSVVGDISAGARSVSGMGPSLAMRIMTGAPMPAGADTVVPQEDTDRGVARVEITEPLYSGTNVRKTGEDLASGDIALGSGAVLGPAQLGLLAAVGRNRVTVRPRPRVIIVSTGNELVEPGQTPAFGEIVDVNGYLIAAAVRDAGADAVRIGIVPDTHDKLIDMLESQLLRADIIVTTGGVSDGPYDVVRQALGDLGTVEFTSVAMDPGISQGFGHLGAKTPIICLPGNPASAQVSFEMFVRPAIRRLLGKRQLQRVSAGAAALERMTSPAGLRQYRRGLLHREGDGTYSVAPMGGTGSHLVASMAASNCLIVIDEAVTEVVEGSRVRVIPLLLSQR